MSPDPHPNPSHVEFFSSSVGKVRFPRSQFPIPNSQHTKTLENLSNFSLFKPFYLIELFLKVIFIYLVVARV
jgi:hypothetical protein